MKNKPLVAIEAHWLLSETGGNATYAENITRCLIEAAEDVNFLFFTTHPEASERFRLNEAGHRAVRIAPSNRWLRLPVMLPLHCRLRRPRLLHSYSPIVPSWVGVPYVATVHDILFESHPDLFTAAEHRLFRYIRPTLEKAEKVITISQFTKEKLVGLYGLPQEKITITPPAAGREFSPEAGDGDESARKKYGLPEGCVLYVGRLNVRKGLSALLRAYSMLDEDLRREHPLAIAGRGEAAGLLREAARSAGIEDIVTFTGYVDQADLPSVYRGAAVMAFLSEGEGFGLPALEAMACGVPVVAANATSLPEVVGDAGILIEPGNAEEAAEAIRRLLADESHRRELSRRAVERSRLFSWRTAAERTLEVYGEIMGKT